MDQLLSEANFREDSFLVSDNENSDSGFNLSDVSDFSLDFLNDNALNFDLNDKECGKIFDEASLNGESNGIFLPQQNPNLTELNNAPPLFATQNDSCTFSKKPKVNCPLRFSGNPFCKVKNTTYTKSSLRRKQATNVFLSENCDEILRNDTTEIPQTQYAGNSTSGDLPLSLSSAQSANGIDVINATPDSQYIYYSTTADADNSFLSKIKRPLLSSNDCVRYRPYVPLRTNFNSCALYDSSPSNETGIFAISEEERETFLAEGLPLPRSFPLSKFDDRNLKKVRRKIKNKLSAQESRRKKKEYMEALERKVEVYGAENFELRKRLDTLETNNRSLLSQLRQLQRNLTFGSNKSSAKCANPGGIQNEANLCLSSALNFQKTNLTCPASKAAVQPLLQRSTAKVLSTSTTSARPGSSCFMAVFFICFSLFFTAGNPPFSMLSASSNVFRDSSLGTLEASTRAMSVFSTFKYGPSPFYDLSGRKKARKSDETCATKSDVCPYDSEVEMVFGRQIEPVVPNADEVSELTQSIDAEPDVHTNKADGVLDESTHANGAEHNDTNSNSFLLHTPLNILQKNPPVTIQQNALLQNGNISTLIVGNLSTTLAPLVQ